MARQLKCYICGEEFTYTKRGRTPSTPICSVCAESPDAKELLEERKSSTTSTKGPSSSRYSVYYEFVGPAESEKPFEPGEKLYFVPRGIFHKEDSLRRYGRVCTFVRYAEDERPGRVYVEVVYRRDGKPNPEVLWTTKDKLTRFRRVKSDVTHLTEYGEVDNV